MRPLLGAALLLRASDSPPPAPRAQHNGTAPAATLGGAAWLASSTPASLSLGGGGAVAPAATAVATTPLKHDDGGVATLDLASPALADGWITHLAMGEASFDSFVHDPRGPVFTGSADFGGCQWPVNGFLYGGAGASSANQTLYVGCYGTGYRKPFDMLAMSSTDNGRTFATSTRPFICGGQTLYPGVGANHR